MSSFTVMPDVMAGVLGSMAGMLVFADSSVAEIPDVIVAAVRARGALFISAIHGLVAGDLTKPIRSVIWLSVSHLPALSPVHFFEYTGAEVLRSVDHTVHPSHIGTLLDVIDIQSLIFSRRASKLPRALPVSDAVMEVVVSGGKLDSDIERVRSGFVARSAYLATKRWMYQDLVVPMVAHDEGRMDWGESPVTYIAPEDDMGMDIDLVDPAQVGVNEDIEMDEPHHPARVLAPAVGPRAFAAPPIPAFHARANYAPAPAIPLPPAPAPAPMHAVQPGAAPRPGSARAFAAAMPSGPMPVNTQRNPSRPGSFWANPDGRPAAPAFRPRPANNATVLQRQALERASQRRLQAEENAINGG